MTLIELAREQAVSSKLNREVGEEQIARRYFDARLKRNSPKFALLNAKRILRMLR